MKKKYIYGGSLIVAIFVVLFLTIDFSNDADPRNDFKTFVHQMENSSGLMHHIYGGTIISSGDVVTAMNVPSAACVAASWNLMKKGTVTINGHTPIRVTAAKLSSLCYSGDDVVLEWKQHQK
jgi:hypothetical protein